MNTQDNLDRENDFQKILVAVDESSACDRVFKKAMQLAEKYGSQLRVFHCTKDPTSVTTTMLTAGSINGYGGVYSKEVYEAEEQLRQETEARVQEWLRYLVKQASDRGINAEFDYQFGDAGKGICDLAHAWEADLIIVGRRGRTGLSEILLGSVSNYVLHHAPCSVLIVQQ
jgi:nucleotide-binding universal stress UspA family protein